MVALAATGLVVRGDAQQAEAATTSLNFSPAAISLEGTGDSTTVDLEVTGLGTNAADTVQVNIQHDSQFSISSPACGALYPSGSISAAVPVTGGTVFTCALQNGPVAISGVVASFTITKNDDVTGETVLSLLGTGAFRTTFFEAGDEVLPGTLGSLSVWDLLDPIGDQSVDENATLTPVAITSTVDGAIPTLSATVDGEDISGFPWITFTDNLDRTATFEATPGFDNAGVYTIAVTSDNGTVSGTETFTLTVNDVNRPPVLPAVSPDPQVVAEGASLPVPLTATDDDGDGMVITATIQKGAGAVVGIPDGVFSTITDNGDGTGSLDFNPGFTDSGTYTVVVTVTDNSTAPNGPLDVTDTFTLTVNNANQDPTVDAIDPQTVAEGGTIDVGISGSDLDGESITLSATIDGADIPTGFSTILATVADAATLTFTPPMGQVSSDTDFAIVVTADDGIGGTGQATFTLTVTNIPEITAPAGTVTLQGLIPAEDHDTQFNTIDPKVDLVLAADGATGTAVLTADVDPDGSFAFSGMAEDVYLLRIRADAYFTHILGGIDLTTSDFDLGADPVKLLGGLIVPTVTVVDGLGLAAVLGSFGVESTALTSGRLDGAGNFVNINADSAVTSQDVSTLISNFGLSGDQPWL